MSLDFFVTHFYRLVVHDMVLMSDVYWFYTQKRKEGRSLQEFSEILANLLEIESQNFDEINTAKLSIGEGEGMLLIIWDYFHDVIIKHLLDDASQFPFWASKVIVTSQPIKFGAPAVRAYWACLKNIYHTRGVRGMFQGSLPYMVASCYDNYRFLTKVTIAFISNVFSKIPQPGSSRSIEDEATPPPTPREVTPVASVSDVPVATGMFRHKTRSNADLSVLTADTGSTRSTSGVSPVNKTTSNAFSEQNSTIVNSSDHSSVLGREGDDRAVSLTTARPFAASVDSAKDNSNSSSGNNSSGSYAMTAGTAGAPKGFKGYPINTSHNGNSSSLRVAGSGHYSSVATIRPKKDRPAPTTDTLIMRQLQRACVAFMTHPLIVLSAAMVKNPLYQGHNAFVSFFKMWSNVGIGGFYSGFRARFVLSLIPLSPVVLMGLPNLITYRCVDGQGSMDSTGGVLSVIKHITSEPVNADGSGSVMSLFNYGLLTAAHVLPGFVTFVAMRSLSWLVLGSSLNRKHQISRRKEIVDAHISLIDKKTQFDNL